MAQSANYLLISAWNLNFLESHAARVPFPTHFRPSIKASSFASRRGFTGKSKSKTTTAPLNVIIFLDSLEKISRTTIKKILPGSDVKYLRIVTLKVFWTFGEKNSRKQLQYCLKFARNYQNRQWVKISIFYFIFIMEKISLLRTKLSADEKFVLLYDNYQKQWRHSFFARIRNKPRFCKKKFGIKLSGRIERFFESFPLLTTKSGTSKKTNWLPMQIFKTFLRHSLRAGHPLGIVWFGFQTIRTFTIKMETSAKILLEELQIQVKLCLPVIIKLVLSNSSFFYFWGHLKWIVTLNSSKICDLIFFKP